MERIGNKHSPRVDDEMKHEVEPLARSGRESRVEEGFVKEEEGDDREPEVGPAQERADLWTALGADPITARRELSRHLDASTFPAEREALIADAAQHAPPEPVLEMLRQLPEGLTFDNVYEVWVNLGGPAEELQGRPRRDA
jgi:hypothetical protein